ncbi:hypothetical protein RMN57_19020 [Kitasatospora sp. CM 4170]|uniref:Uncharacterized protein n=4 Tax=Streptomycetaceae TaxID=2062 RepID=A0A0F2TEH4_STRR3|nr:hypothetical protein [Kitasatospora sp. CM 4170]KJS55567.1 hypothetical protein VM98_12205 [Streptomyces rubellomurinus subsp. indigoferus]KJS60705.1 hypothetical protein VM95_19280 [Streptomyces rubellomurinus]MQS13354.1 hypothetical protein [Streptomyces kaniharaensis]WNM46647.1 hypothetical protein RMN57_19020 [Kitasatospora sp. CM 4170]
MKMSVYVKLSAEARSPAEPSKGPLDLQYEDGADGVTFEYDLHPSGALRVLRVFEDTPHRIEACFSPGAWLQVAGTYLRSGSEY